MVIFVHLVRPEIDLRLAERSLQFTINELFTKRNQMFARN